MVENFKTKTSESFVKTMLLIITFLLQGHHKKIVLYGGRTNFNKKCLEQC